MTNETIIYQLDVQDIQNVANEELGRDLSFEEVEKILESIAERIPWYDAIAYSIYEKISPAVDRESDDDEV